MDGLRLILLALGALVVLGVYAYSRRDGRRRGDDVDVFPERARSAKDADDEFPEDLPPLHATEDAVETGTFAVDADPERTAPREAPAHVEEKSEEKIIVLNILPAEAGETFPGVDLLDVFDRAGLEYGQYGVFHRIRETAEGPMSVFSVASATEPGSFDITGMADERFRGLSLFMLLPGPVRGVDAFADMLATSRRIAEQIRGDVKDHNRSTLTRQTAHHVREEIIAFEHRLQVKG